MTPTPYGEILIRDARRMLTDFGFVREEMVALGSGLRGILRIGCVPGAVPELLAPPLSAYKQLHPRVAVSVNVDTRSEEHASELQSLMRISYAVFCLKKKKNNK